MQADAESPREPGYYWVKCNKEWLPAEWLETWWTVLGLMDEPWQDSNFSAIGPRISPPEEA